MKKESTGTDMSGSEIPKILRFATEQGCEGHGQMLYQFAQIHRALYRRPSITPPHRQFSRFQYTERGWHCVLISTLPSSTILWLQTFDRQSRRCLHCYRWAVCGCIYSQTRTPLSIDCGQFLASLCSLLNGMEWKINKASLLVCSWKVNSTTKV